MSHFSHLDIAPTVANVLGISLPKSDGRPIDAVASWGCKNVVLIIVDSLGYDLYMWMHPGLKNISALEAQGFVFKAKAASNHTTPSIASILSGLLPEHHEIFDKQGAKDSSLPSIPEIASASGLKSAVIMEENGAQVYQGLIEIVGAVSDKLSAAQFDREICRMTLDALSRRPKLLVSYFIGIDKIVHMGLGLKDILEAALFIDRCVGKIVRAADAKTLFILCGDHPVHSGRLKRTKEPYCIALILAKN
jgi:predicted AlkP superfamily pyrophosphatase or phosphodiesterase